MSAALILATLMLCVWMTMVHSPVLAMVDIQEMDSPVKVNFFTVYKVVTSWLCSMYYACML